MQQGKELQPVGVESRPSPSLTSAIRRRRSESRADKRIAVSSSAAVGETGTALDHPNLPDVQLDTGIHHSILSPE